MIKLAAYVVTILDVVIRRAIAAQEIDLPILQQDDEQTFEIVIPVNCWQLEMPVMFSEDGGR
ncbi:MAG: hypothetical protein ACRBM6_32075 [Geminicoccales bacterium]